ncbi:MAG: BTAD domain-containing putative transcriptional regulator [Anaerolineaceae bacterium]|nr:BTAD domain-containing putative transcriptional regulator [Anaerolineaceae bacterium]
MKPSILLRTKFLVPRPRADFLPRPRLLDWLKSNSDKRLTLLSAPAGYGKTTLLADFINASTRSFDVAQGKPFAWYQLDAQDSDPTVFLTYLIESLRSMKRAPESLTRAIGQTAQSLLDSADASISPRRVLTVLINELAEQIDSSWLIVLEDYHYVASPVVHQLVDFLLENAPENLHMIVSTRVDPPLALARLRARGQLAELRSSSLRFRDDEVTKWMQADAPELSIEDLNLLSEKTEGWAAALQIIRSSLNGDETQNINALLSGLSGSQQFVFDYLAEEVFKKLPEDLQEFLLRVSILQQMDAVACNAVAGVNDAQSILEDLEKQNLFLSSLDSQKRWYRYHYLFREFLLSRLQRVEAESVAGLERSAGRHYEAQGELEAALSHYLNAHEFESAARIVSIFAADYVERGRVEVLHRYLSALPADVMKSNPELLLQHGNAHWRLGQTGAAIAAYEDARSAFSTRNDSNGMCRALTHLAEVNRAQGHYRRAETLSTEALSFTNLDHAARAQALMALAKSVGFLTGMNKGRELAEQAVEEARLAGDEISALARANFLQSLGQICWWHGDPQATVRYCQEALQIAPDEFSPIGAQAHISLVTPFLYWRELDKALQHAERGLEIAQTLHLKELLPSAYTALGNVLTRLGETARAEACLRQGMEIGQQLGLASFEQLMATGFLAYNLCDQGRVDEARQLAEGALWSYTGNPDTYEAYVCRSVLADVALENLQTDKAEALFMELLEVGERRQFRIPLAMVYFGLAYIHLETKRRESGLEYARKALRLIEASRVFQLFLDQGARSHIVTEALIAAGEKSPFLERVLENLPEKKIQISLASRHSIQAQCFGSFRVLVNGEEVSQERWVSAKARDLLAYFVTLRGEKTPADKAFDAIWGEKESVSRTAFHTALSRLRNALKSGKENPRLILVEVGEYWLDSARFTIDVDEFNSALAQAHAVNNQSQRAEWYERAVSLYRGEYLQNLYYEWVFPERRRLAQAYLNALQELTSHHLANQSPKQAVAYIETALPLDAFNEDLYCLAMRAYGALNDRAGVARVYSDLKRQLHTELNSAPLPETDRLYRELVA